MWRSYQNSTALLHLSPFDTINMDIKSAMDRWGLLGRKDKVTDWGLAEAGGGGSSVFVYALGVFVITDRGRRAQEVGGRRAALRDAGAADAGGAHLCEHLVEPLQGAVQVQLDPAGGAGHRLSPGRCTTKAGMEVKRLIQSTNYVFSSNKWLSQNDKQTHNTSFISFNIFRNTP